jgi:hypothetical protein
LKEENEKEKCNNKISKVREIFRDYLTPKNDFT